MNMAVGGYFELHLERYGEHMHSGIFLNSGSSALELFLKLKKPDEIFVPDYVCGCLIPVIQKCNTKVIFYEVDNQLNPIVNIDRISRSVILLVNYFGIMDSLISTFRDVKGSVVLDLSQAFFFTMPEGWDGFYSPRKFFGVPDGGILSGPCTKDASGIPIRRGKSFGRCGHLLKRLDVTPEAGYSEFREADANLGREGLKRMSRLSERILRSICYSSAAERRLSNYRHLQQLLEVPNCLEIPIVPKNAPMAYPLRLSRKNAETARRVLKENRIFVPKFWPEEALNFVPGREARELARTILPLPIDHRYERRHMKKMAHIINGACL